MATDPVDPKAYYGYVFDDEKAPTPVLNALLKAITQHIVDELGDKSCKSLVPEKLAPFFRAAGGNMDTFLAMPSRSISYVWQVLGCQHALQPTSSDFEPPSIPALTVRGFVRWMSINILLDPEEYYTYIQTCLKEWDLKHPETGEPFPKELPREAFPKETDEGINKWHEDCAETLRREATPREESRSTFPDARVKGGYSHVRGSFAAAAGAAAGAGAAASAFTSSRPRPASSPRARTTHSRPVTFSHVPGRDPRSPPMPSPSERRGSSRRGSSPEDAARRRSFSDYANSAHDPNRPHSRSSEHLRAPDPHHVPAAAPRRHSQPRHCSSPSDSDRAPSPHTSHKRRHPGPPHQSSPDPGSVHIRRVNTQPQPVRPRAPSPGPSPPASVPGSTPTINADGDERRPRRREDEPRTRFHIPFISSFLPGGDRPRSSSRQQNGGPPSSRHARDDASGSKSGRWTRNDDYDSDPTSSDDSRERQRRRRKMYDRDRERERDRDRDRDHVRDRDRMRDSDRDRDRDRDLEDERDRRSRRERERDRDRERERDRHFDRHGDRGKYTYRPDIYRRTSSHADIDRWRGVDVEHIFRERERDRDSPRDERRRADPRGASPVVQVTGVSGRKYPTAAETGWSP